MYTYVKMNREYTTSESENIRHRKSRYSHKNSSTRDTVSTTNVVEEDKESQTKILEENKDSPRENMYQWDTSSLVKVLAESSWLYLLTIVLIVIIVLLVFGWNKGLYL